MFCFFSCSSRTTWFIEMFW